MHKLFYTRRDFLRIMGVSGAGLVMTHTPSTAEAQEKQLPNIIYIMADDLGYGDLSCYNPDSKIPTPHIDALANAGMRFTDAHSPAAVCTPTRYGVLTGRYCWRTWLKRDALEGDGSPLIETERLTIASLLKQHGYRSACVGKWHLGLGWTFLQGKEPLQNSHWKTGH
jgi:arylsulfatase A